MKIAGIIAEYNPFHNGHLYHIEETRKLGATHIVAVMSGNFVQRAEPAIASKFERARIAAVCGADLVIELPLVRATASGEHFAHGAISILNALGIVDMLSFGSECGDLRNLNRAVDAVTDARVIRRTKQLTEIGESYPSAQTKALEIFYPDLSNILEQPNNTLGIDYLKSLKKTASKIDPFTIMRKGAKHDGEEISGQTASAGKIRELIRTRGDFSGLVPRECEFMLLDAAIDGRISEGMTRIESAVLYKLRNMTRDEMNKLPDASNGLGDRVFNAVQKASSVDSLYELSKTKRYTMSRVRRVVLAALLDITEDDYISVPYIRLLAIGQNGGEILRAMKRKCKLPVRSSLTDLIELRGIAAETAKKESFATDIFNLTLSTRGPTGEDFTSKLFTL